jgi:hypothetical protein
MKIDNDYTSPEAVERLLAPPQSYGNGYECCKQMIALARELREARSEIKVLEATVKTAHRVGYQHGMGPCICEVCRDDA